MATDNSAFLQPIALGTMENMRNAQRQRPSADNPENSPPACAAKPGVVMLTGDFRWPRYSIINYGGSMTPITTGVPGATFNPAGITDVQANWVSGTDVGNGINTNFSGGVVRYYAIGCEAIDGTLAQGVSPTNQPTGRLMQNGWDAVTAFKSITLSQNANLRKVTLTIPDLSASLPTVEGVSTFKLTVWCFLSSPADAKTRRAAPGFYIGECASTGGTVVDGYSVADLNSGRQYWPSTFQNFPAVRAVWRVGDFFVGAGGGESNQDAVFGTVQTKSVNGTYAKVRTGSANNILVLRRDSDASAKPYDPRVMVITNIVRNSGVSCTVTVENYQTLSNLDTVFIDDVVTDITGINGTSHAVSSVGVNTFNITGVYGAGTYTSGGEAAELVFTWPDWVVGKAIFVEGQNKYFTIERIVSDGGTNTGIEISDDVAAAITSNKSFQVAGKQFLYPGISDERGYTFAPSPLWRELTGKLNGNVEAGIAAPNVVGASWVYSRTTGVLVSNLIQGWSINDPVGLAEDGSETPQVSDSILTYGTAGPGAICAGPAGCLLGYSVELGPWKQLGSTQELLDPEQVLEELYLFFRFGEDGQTDATPNIEVTYNQNLNCAFWKISSFSQEICYDFRSGVINIFSALGQRPMSIATMELYRPMAYDPVASEYILDPLANVGQVTLTGYQMGDLWETNGNFFSDGLTTRGCTVGSLDHFRGTVTAVSAQSISLSADSEVSEFYVAGTSPTGANGVLVLVDTTLANPDPPDATVIDVTLSGSDRYATCVTEDDHGITIGTLVTVTGVVGITGLNGVQYRVSDVPFPDAFTLDGGATSTFGGVYVSGGTAAFPTFNDRIGSYRGMDDGLSFPATNQWTASAPLVGDIVQVGAFIFRYESRNFEAGMGTVINRVENFILSNVSDQTYAVQFAVLPSGNTNDPGLGTTVTTTYPGLVSGLGRDLDMTRTEGGFSVRLLAQLFPPSGGALALNSLKIAYEGSDGPKTKAVQKFPQQAKRIDKAEWDDTGDLNTVRGAGLTQLRARPGSRSLTADPDVKPNGFGPAQATNLVDGVILYLRVGGQPFVVLSTYSQRVTEGFFYGPYKILPVMPLGATAEAVPPAAY